MEFDVQYNDGGDVSISKLMESANAWASKLNPGQVRLATASDVVKWLQAPAGTPSTADVDEAGMFLGMEDVDPESADYQALLKEVAKLVATVRVTKVTAPALLIVDHALTWKPSSINEADVVAKFAASALGQYIHMSQKGDTPFFYEDDVRSFIHAAVVTRGQIEFGILVQKPDASLMTLKSGRQGLAPFEGQPVLAVTFKGTVREEGGPKMSGHGLCIYGRKKMTSTLAGENLSVQGMQKAVANAIDHGPKSIGAHCDAKKWNWK